ncbi:MAG: methylated-DNA--[protein]-cysteine S-methyltransferase [Xanthomonadales bacterium]|nr:methylated-DNA--[protein]-cysteine S-methyltransferase [Xanthomonadales bacterium]
MRAVKVVQSPVGPLTLIADRGHLLEIAFGQTEQPGGYAAVLDEAIRQLAEYFLGRRQSFLLALRPEGSNFQRAVWAALDRVPYGRTCSYAELATAAGRRRGYRAVGGALGKNPLPIVVPCHRVVRADGQLGGYVGGAETKRFLLDLEQDNVRRSEEAGA